ncbi:MAG: class II fructose-bisphosphate aldolase [Sphaerochaetaceae bacterium]
MLVNLQTIMEYAQNNKIAIGAFNVCNWESATSIVEGAERCNRPVIIQYASGHSPFMSIEDATMIMLYVAKKAKVPVCVNYDHGRSFELVMKAIRLGYTSVMIDASSKSYEENLEITKEVVKVAHSVGVGVEGEIGHILSHVKGISADTINPEDEYTHPDVAKKFIEESGVDALAIAFGTAHGLYLKKPVLDLDRISRIKEVKDFPYVMHGGSGLSKEEFQVAIKNGIRKINYYTYMSLAAGMAVKKSFEGQKPDEKVFFHDITKTAKEATEKNIEKAIKTFALEI